MYGLQLYGQGTTVRLSVVETDHGRLLVGKELIPITTVIWRGQ